MITSLLALNEISGEEKYFDFAERFIDYYVDGDGNILGYDIEKYNLDDLNEGRVLFELYRRTGKKKYRLAIENQKKQLDSQPRTCTSNFWHKLIYPNQIWLDGIYMAQVFSTLYAKEYGGKNYSDMLNQIKNVNNYMQNPSNGLYYHGLDCSKEAFWADKKNGLSKNFWLRSIGWFTVALIDIIDLIDDEKARDELSKIFTKLIDSITAYRDGESGMYWQVVDQPGRDGNYLETSGSSMIAYAQLKGARLGILDSKYSSLGRQTFDGICKKYLKVSEGGELNLGGICLVAGLGPENNRRRDGSYEYYVSEPIVENDAKGVAPFVLCYTEIIRLLKAD
jgi:unsaturated rhamnogalacturonyl hydrolase